MRNVLRYIFLIVGFFLVVAVSDIFGIEPMSVPYMIAAAAVFLIFFATKKPTTPTSVEFEEDDPTEHDDSNVAASNLAQDGDRVAESARDHSELHDESPESTTEEKSGGLTVFVVGTVVAIVLVVILMGRDDPSHGRNRTADTRIFKSSR